MPRLYLATPEVDDPSQLAASLPGLLAAADVAAVLVRLKQTDQRTMISRVKALAPAVQNAGAALLLDGHVELVARAGADGAHLTGIAAHGGCPAVAEARPHRRRRRPCRRGTIRWPQAKLGADYVLFGEPDASGAAALDRRRSPSACNGGMNCSSRLASALPPRARRLPNSPPPARISCWSAISSGPIRAAPEAALIDAEQAIRQAHAAAFGKAKAEQG